MKKITIIVVVCVAVLDGCSVKQPKNTISAQIGPQRTSECRIAHIDKRRILQAEDRKEELESQGFFILTNDEVNYVTNELDLTSSIIVDGNRVSNNTQNQLNKIRIKQCKVVYVNAAKTLENNHQAKASKKQLEKEFREWDKRLVGMEKSNASSETMEAEKKSFSYEFNFRRNEELAKLLKTVTDEVRDFSQRNKIDLVVTEATEDYKKIAGTMSFPDATEDFQRFAETLSEDKTKGSN
ncbi:OmpH family outer membrane protein [Methylobacter tundripaludum]|uniref:OmpH family outer membrane protein n=1 Tax=Methylobacter tundripaludum TaxID=173365 RepID=UPI0004DF60C5|nr:OmpH family outer membrane protein [Methylobacter tundripaludum]